MRSETSRGPLFAHEEPEPLYSAGSEPAVWKVRDIGTCFCVRALCVHGIVGYLYVARSIARRGPGRGSTKDTRVRHHLSRSGTGKGDRLCRSEPINPSGSSASASLAFWPAWPTAAAAPCWPGDGVRVAMRSRSPKRTSSPRIARSLALAGGFAVTAHTAWNDDFGCGVAATSARRARVEGPWPTGHWFFAISPMSPIHPATATASLLVARVAVPCSATA